jgi:hypothetical protein
MSSWTPTKYKTRNWAEYNLSLKQRGSLSIWFDPKMTWEAAPSGRRGRQQAYSDAAIQACLTLKILFGLPLRQTTGFVASLLKLVGLEWSVPDFSTLCRRQKTLLVAIPYKGSAGPLHLLIDSTGIKAEGEGEWNARKHGGPKRRLWRKIHIGIDEETLEIRAIEVTSSSIGDAPMLPDLLNQIPPDQELGSVTADGAYDTRKCHDAIAARDAHAIIPPRKNAKLWKPDTPGARARNEDALCEITRSASLGARLRPPGCGDPNPCRDPKRLHSAWHSSYHARSMNPSGVRGNSSSQRFVQQSRWRTHTT